MPRSSGPPGAILPPIMRVLCAWCLKEGKPEAEALIGDREPLGEDGPPSHGICPHHRREVEERAASLRAEAERQQAEAEELRRRVDP